ncbi:MAG: hypothetical protein EOQ42_24965 [Mesorhizobium sp.]|uniref:hypothetical protein n=1 Tax=unclassified Mesorhizobium TaxID=325217 RepID=UPI000F7569A8|nr:MULTISPECIES: hypothetical protein [unclassified Mesorhizobium]RWB51651.1 MAG: hypothetical protein EOQ42_24965 [Mesorhizobium sp.]AZN98008.1 hypothetical protein EJ066_12515 [Mesorhizobium sp. M9A.F.Ca.ET.002.03.1.2]AZO19574.1 hypothetical protein EJ070_01880 [Mesorhizobium sp. M1E.F.Ca.ET.045.02.1.1]RWJ38140.1 MAG: hypothetical protein EOR29_31395 [Mesorhizobium sp.]RWJ78517.1 MAG: hypothetical protein EOR36_32035 [Mesorhizobium sp.]
MQGQDFGLNQYLQSIPSPALVKYSFAIDLSEIQMAKMLAPPITDPVDLIGSLATVAMMS